jgi:hypothetical protein
MVVIMVGVVVVAASAVAVTVPPLPMTATTLPSCYHRCCYSAAKTSVGKFVICLEHSKKYNQAFWL